MKFLVISDTHSKHRQIPVWWLDIEDKENTIIIHAGDISNIGRLNEIENFCLWFNDLGFYKHIFICGNHDFGFQDAPKEVANIIAKYPNIIYLQDNSVTIDGVVIYGSPWQPEFHNWAFNLKRGKELLDKWNMIDENVDVLITHGPPYGISDFVPYNGGEFVGCYDLLDVVSTKLPKLKAHIFGHIHYSYGTVFKNNITFVNASTVNEQYMVVNKPIVFEV